MNIQGGPLGKLLEAQIALDWKRNKEKVFRSRDYSTVESENFKFYLTRSLSAMRLNRHQTERKTKLKLFSRLKVVRIILPASECPSTVCGRKRLGTEYTGRADVQLIIQFGAGIKEN